MELLLLIWIACGGLAAWIASQKNRPLIEGLILGLLLGLIGVVLEALLPNKEAR